MSGDRTVYCDGHQWNSTRPDCLGSAPFFAPNSHLMLSVPPTAPILSLPNPGRSVQVGQRLTFTCRSQGGSSVKSLCSIYQTPFRRKPRSTPCLPDQQPTSGGRDRERRRDSAHDRLGRTSPGSSGGMIFGNLSKTIFSKVVCTAINSVSRRPVYSKFHLIRIQCEPHLLNEHSLTK